MEKLRKLVGRMLRAAQRRLEYRQEAARLAKLGSNKDIFDHHYRTNEWKNAESVSGAGSTLAYTENIRAELPALIERFDVRTLLDAPCGDYNWFRKVVFKREIDYLGGDIVEQLVAKNQAEFGAPHVGFTSIDITRDALPKVDLWLCRDCLFHLSNHDIALAIDNFLRSDIRFLLTSMHTECDVNADIPTGSFRLLDLRLPPFDFPQPIAMMDDWIAPYPKRQLALWDRAALLAHRSGRAGGR